MFGDLGRAGEGISEVARAREVRSPGQSLPGASPALRVTGDLRALRRALKSPKSPGVPSHLSSNPGPRPKGRLKRPSSQKYPAGQPVQGALGDATQDPGG